LKDRGCRKLSADDVATGPQFVGDPKTHGIDKPRGGGFSIMQDLQKDLHKEMKKESEAGPKTAADSQPELKSRRAMYWGAPDRVYRLTRNEQENGTAVCPKCKKDMALEPFTKSEKLYNCPSCGFKVPSSKTTTTRITIDVDKGTGEVDVDVTTARRGRKNAAEVKTLTLTLDAGEDVADLEDEITAVLKDYDGKHVSSKKSGISWKITWELPGDTTVSDVIDRVRKIPEWKSTNGMSPRWGK
jgi:DNA-directed RNA polymerase subunit RPC12/RpoP